MSLPPLQDSTKMPASGFAPVTLTTERLFVRPCVPGDAARLFALHSDPETMRFWSTAPWTDPEEGLRKVERDEAHRVSGTGLAFGLESRATRELVGTCALHVFHRLNRRCEIGYLLARIEWGKGLMQEALRAVITHAFERLAMHRLEADIDPENGRSARILERLGFRREGLLRERWFVNDRWSDSALYALLETEWPGP